MFSEAKPSQKNLLLIWFVGCAILVMASWQQIMGLTGWDPDDQLRLVQLRDFLAGQGWSDTNQSRLNTPYGSAMHWSRFTELPLAFIILLMSPIIGQHGAEMVAGVVVPLLLLLGTGYFLADIARRIGVAAAAPVAMILCLMTTTLLAAFMPMRIDHHGWQIMLASLSLWTLFRADKRSSGFLLGAALALWLHISLEGAPLTAVFFGYLGWRWIYHKAHGRRLLFTVLAFGPITALLFLTSPSGEYYCDSISLPHLAAIAVATVIMGTALILRPASWQMRAAATICGGGAALAAMGALAPTCLTDGFADLDPVVRSYWYSNITEGLPIWRQGDLNAIGWIMAAVMGFFGLFVLRRAIPVSQRGDLRMIGWFQIASLAVALLVFRAAAVACAFAIPVLANWIVMMIEKYRGHKLPFDKAKSAIAIMLVVMAGPVTIQVADGIQGYFAGGGQQNTDRGSTNINCQSVSSVASLATLENARIVAPFDMGPAILQVTPHSVLASSHHRNNAGMRDQIDIFRSSPTIAEKIIRKRGITHLAICPDEAEMLQYQIRDPNGLWAQIQDGKALGWLQPLKEQGNGIQIWAVRDTKTR